MVHKTLLYLKKLTSSIFSGFSIFLSLVDILSFCFHFAVPNFPSYITIILTSVIFFIASYRVWLDELAEKDKSLNELSIIKNKTPNYSIKVRVNPTVFSIKEKIYSVDREIEDEKNNLKDRGFLDSILPEMKIIGMEKPEAKIRRLTEYCQELKRYDEDIKNLHKISIEIVSDKNDENIEIELRTTNSDQLFIEDDYIENNIPITSYPSHILMGNNLQIPLSTTHDYVSPDNIAKIFIRELNSKKCHKIPDQEFYIKTNNAEVVLVATIYSRNLREPKTLRIKIDF